MADRMFSVIFVGRSDRRLVDGLRKLRKRLKYGKDIGRDALAVVDKWIQSNFTTEGGKVGGWKPLKEATIARRRQKSSAVLQDTGWLKRSWVYAVTTFEATLTEGNKKGKVTFGKTIGEAFYGDFHNKGKGVPKRQIIPYPYQVTTDVKAAYSHHMDKETKKI